MANDGRRRIPSKGVQNALALEPLQAAPHTMTATAVTASARDWHGAGWHASTWELKRGLDVREGLPDDALPDECLMAYLVTQGIGE